MQQEHVTYDVYGIIENVEEVRVAVPKWEGGDLGENIEQCVAIHVDQVVAQTAFIVHKQLDCS